MDCNTNCMKMMHLGNKNMFKQQKMRVQFHLITILIQNQAVHHPNQHHHILDHGHPKKVFKNIKRLHIRFDGSDNIEQLYILPSRWLFLLKFDKIGDAIHGNFQNASCIPMQFLFRKIQTVGIPKPTVLVIIFVVFIWLLSFINAGGKTISIC